MNRFFILIGVLFTTAGIAQKSTNSPYSIYGLGQPELQSTTAMSSMGGVSTAVVNPLWINAANPASYTDITRPSFNFDVKDEYLTLASGNVTQGSNSFSIQNFSFAFPVLNNSRKYKRRLGVSFGLTPYTSSGYELFFGDEVDELGQVEYHFFGEGGINTLSAGVGYDIYANKKRTNVLSAGVNGQYIFGNLERSRATQFQSSAAASSLYRSENIEISDIGYNASLRFYHVDTIVRRTVLNDSTIIKTETPIMLSIGANIKPALQLNTVSEQVEYTYTDSFQRPNVIDTLLDQSVSGQTSAPMTYSVGVSLNINNAWTLAADYSHTNWSSLMVNGANAGLNNSDRVAFGAEWVPEYDKKGRGKYMRVMRYRLGASYEQTMLNLAGTRPNRFGINFGLGFPLGAASASTSMFNIGGEVAQRQTTGANLNETFFNFHAGFIITPHRYDQWFAKRKYD